MKDIAHYKYRLLAYYYYNCSDKGKYIFKKIMKGWKADQLQQFAFWNSWSYNFQLSFSKKIWYIVWFIDWFIGWKNKHSWASKKKKTISKIDELKYLILLEEECITKKKKRKTKTKKTKYMTRKSVLKNALMLYDKKVKWFEDLDSEPKLMFEKVIPRVKLRRQKESDKEIKKDKDLR